MITSIEQQLSALKGLLCLEVDDQQPAAVALAAAGKSRAGGLPNSFQTSSEEDEAIAKAMEIAEGERDIFMEDIFKEAGKELNEPSF